MVSSCCSCGVHVRSFRLRSNSQFHASDAGPETSTCGAWVPARFGFEEAKLSIQRYRSGSGCKLRRDNALRSLRDWTMVRLLTAVCAWLHPAVCTLDNVVRPSASVSSKQATGNECVCETASQTRSWKGIVAKRRAVAAGRGKRIKGK